MNAAHLLILIALALLSGCAVFTSPKMEITKADGEVIRVAHPKPLQDRLYADGSRMNWVDVATYKSMGALPPPRRQPVWGCMAADLGTTAAFLTSGLPLAEANPLGLPVAVPLGLVQVAWVKHAEKNGNDYPAKAFARVHCAAAVWNVLMILWVL